MTTAPERRSLPLIDLKRHGSRSHVTCLYRCGNACDKPEPNQTDNEHIRDVIAQAVSRRGLMAGGAAGTAALVLGGLAEPVAAAPLATAPKKKGRRGGKARKFDLARIGFTPVAANRADNVTVPTGFTSDVLMKWGDKVTADAPEFNPLAQTPESASKQFGYNCDYVGVLPLERKKALLVANHEYTNPELMFPATGYTEAQKIAIEMASHGMSIVQIKEGKAPGSWKQDTKLAKAKYNRRLHVGSVFELDGPAAGDPRLVTSADPTGRLVHGTLNNCAGGTTPWGTILSGEENFNQYFDLPTGGTLDARYAEAYKRYGVTGSDTRNWSSVDPRFDLTKEPHESHRFGWVVEVDPLNPKSAPRKHTMLGRFKHEGANVVIAENGKAVAYMGDDERGDYIYRFVSKRKFDPGTTRKARKRNMKLLTEGTLYVAKFYGHPTTPGTEHMGVGLWIPLCSDTESFVPGMSVADVLIFTRLAADKVGPTKMDRPEDVEPNPVNGKVYAALTNNSDRGKKQPVDGANPVDSSMVRTTLGGPLTKASGNRNGYVLEMSPHNGDHTDNGFAWDLFLICGDPAAPESYFGGFDKSQVSPISCPDNVAFDNDGNLWISTDGAQLGSHDGIFRVPVKGKDRGKVQQFLTVPVGAEACGPLIHGDDNESLFFAIQHPGEGTGSTYDKPASTWPHTNAFPRPSVGVARKG